MQPNSQARRPRHEDDLLNPLIERDEADRYQAAAAAWARRLARGERAGRAPIRPQGDPARLADPVVRKLVKQREREFQRRINSLRQHVATAPRTASGAIVTPRRRVAPARSVMARAPRARATRARRRPPASDADPPGHHAPGHARRHRRPVAPAERPGAPAPSPAPPAAQAPAQAPSPGSFEAFHEATAGLSGTGRMEAFFGLPEEHQARAWAELAAGCDRRNQYLRREPLDTTLKPLVFHPPDWGPPPPPPPRPVKAACLARARAGDFSAALRAVPAREYVERLTGQEVGRSGFIRCPLPDHEDRTPSFKVNETGWRCFGCCAHGRVFELGAALYGLSTTGADFVELKATLAREMGVSA